MGPPFFWPISEGFSLRNKGTTQVYPKKSQPAQTFETIFAIHMNSGMKLVSIIHPETNSKTHLKMGEKKPGKGDSRLGNPPFLGGESPGGNPRCAWSVAASPWVASTNAVPGRQHELPLPLRKRWEWDSMHKTDGINTYIHTLLYVWWHVFIFV